MPSYLLYLRRIVISPKVEVNDWNIFSDIHNDKNTFYYKINVDRIFRHQGDISKVHKMFHMFHKNADVFA